MKSKYNSEHSLYFNSSGDEVPSATTILKMLNKPQLVKWANYLGFHNLRVENVLSESSLLGSTIHQLINMMLNQYYIIYIDDGKMPLDTIYSYMNSFKVWMNTNNINPILLEKKFSSDKFGGTLDFYGDINGKLTILDFKTSKKIRLTMFLQLALYTILLEERGYKVEQVGILLVNPNYKDEKYINRENLQQYIDFVNKLVDAFHSYYDVNILDNWNESII